jgi:hypothetical protein
MNSQQFDTLIHLLEAIGAGMTVLCGLFLFLFRKINKWERFFVIRDVEHEHLMNDMQDRHPDYQRPAEAAARALRFR